MSNKKCPRIPIDCLRKTALIYVSIYPNLNKSTIDQVRYYFQFNDLESRKVISDAHRVAGKRDVRCLTVVHLDEYAFLYLDEGHFDRSIANEIVKLIHES